MDRDILHLDAMIEAARSAIRIASEAEVETLDAEPDLRSALLWHFTVLGEAATHPSADVKNRFPDVPWRYPASLRNRIVHGYWDIDLTILHTTATTTLPGFAVQLETVLRAVGGSTEDPG